MGDQRRAWVNEANERRGQGRRARLTEHLKLQAGVFVTDPADIAVERARTYTAFSSLKRRTHD